MYFKTYTTLSAISLLLLLAGMYWQQNCRFARVQHAMVVFFLQVLRFANQLKCFHRVNQLLSNHPAADKQSPGLPLLPIVQTETGGLSTRNQTSKVASHSEFVPVILMQLMPNILEGQRIISWTLIAARWNV